MRRGPIPIGGMREDVELAWEFPPYLTFLYDSMRK